MRLNWPLQHVPAAHPYAVELAGRLSLMAAALAPLQGADGFWRASLLDAAAFPNPETTGTACFTYALAWGVNNGVLDAATYARAGLSFGYFSILDSGAGGPYPATTIEFLSPSVGAPAGAGERELRACSRVVCTLSHDGRGERSWLVPFGEYWAVETERGRPPRIFATPPNMMKFDAKNSNALSMPPRTARLVRTGAPA